MNFYKVIAYFDFENDPNSEEPGRPRSRRWSNRRFQSRLNKINERLAGKAFFCVAEWDDGRICAAAVCEHKKYLREIVDAAFPALNIKPDEITADEITLKELTSLLNEADREDFIEDDEEIISRLGLTNVYNEFRRTIEFEENLIECDTDREKLIAGVGKTLYSESLIPEIERIYSCPCDADIVFVHPVHYMFRNVDSGEAWKKAYRSLLNALYDARRLQSRRYWYLNADPTERMNPAQLEQMYKVCRGGTVVIRYTPTDDDAESDRASANRMLIETLCDIIRRFQNDVLTVLCIPVDYPKVSEMFYDYLRSLDIVELREELAGVKRAAEYLDRIVKEKNVEADDDLYARVEEGKKYRADELDEIFNVWYREKLQSTLFIPYKDLPKIQAAAAKEKCRGEAYDELMNMIGLKEAKKVICSAVDYFRAQRIFHDKGFLYDRPVMSMIFTGSPGTAKTTAARLFAEILKDEGILETGNFIECGRGDLVGRFVGWTAPTIQKKFRQAHGGVLFIDEAYSLCDDRDGSFGDEAINTIVQEMENHRSDVLVIFAGYPDKMEGFLRKNPGLRSRIAFHVPFEDYDTDELCAIAGLIAKKKNLIISSGAMDKLHCVFDEIGTQADFGNGRAVRNIIEASKMAMSSRLLTEDVDKLTHEDIVTILPEDISAPRLTNIPSVSRRAIGF